MNEREADVIYEMDKVKDEARKSNSMCTECAVLIKKLLKFILLNPKLKKKTN